LAACALAALVARGAAEESVNLFFAIDAEYYLGLALCGAVRAYSETSAASRRGRPFKFFVLHREPLEAAAICDAAEDALRPRAADWTGCATFEHRATARGACAAATRAPTKTVNAIALVEAPAALARVHRLSEAEAATNAYHCTRRAELVNLLNLAPDAVDAFLLPLGVKRALVLDADAWPERHLLRLYDFADGPEPVVALARWNAKCRSFTEGWNLGDPVVRATLGQDRASVDQRRFRASVLVVRDVEAFCRLDVPGAVAALLERQSALGDREKMWRCGVQQPPLNLALANHTALLASGRRVDPPRVVACDRSVPWRNPYFVRDDCKGTPPASGHPRNETLRRVRDALARPESAEDRLACQVCDTKYGRRPAEH